MVTFKVGINAQNTVSAADPFFPTPSGTSEDSLSC